MKISNIYLDKENIMKTLFGFLASAAGRITRIIAGLILIAIGLMSVGGTWGYVLAVVGLVPLLAGLFDFCVFAPLANYPFQGARLRDAVREHTDKI
jgi:hypothetical protein